MKVKELLTHPNRWIKGDYCNGHGRYCLVGAIMQCYPNPNKRQTVKNKITKYLKLNSSIETWNDTDNRSFKDIRNVIVKLDI